MNIAHPNTHGGRLICLALWLSFAAPAWGQRVSPPTPLPPGAAYPNPGPPTAAFNGGIEPLNRPWDPYAASPPPLTYTAPTPGPAPYVNPGYGAPAPSYPPAPSYAPAPSYGAPPAYGAPVYPANPGYGAAPYGAPPPTYGAPAPYGAPPPTYGAPPGYLPPGEPSFFQQPTRFLQSIHFDYTFLYGQVDQQLGSNSLELNGTFAIPFPILRDPQPLLVTPGFAVHYLDGPIRTNFPNMPDLPPQLFDAYLELGWRPKVNEFLSGDLAFRVGWYSDLEQSDPAALRFLGRGIAHFHLSPRLAIAAGVVYLDRNDVKLLPAGGLIWTPNPDVRWEITFPNPKLAQRLGGFGNSDTWWYVSGEYGGGSWAIERWDGGVDDIDINDLRVMLGLEWHTLNHQKYYFEVGYVFDREVLYTRVPLESFTPDDTVMLRAGVQY